MNQSTNSKFVPALPDDENINENVPTVPDSGDSTINIYEGVAECAMNDSDNLKTIKIKAKNLAEDNVQKKIADYVYGFMKDRYLTLPDDETLSIANEISNITGVKYSFSDSDDDNLTVRAVVTAQIDSKDIMNYLIRFFKERAELKSQNESLRKENEALKHENEALKHENEDLKLQIDELKCELANNYQNTAQVISKEEITLNKAIQLNPNDAEAYYLRGKFYESHGYHENAQSDFRKAKKLRRKG